MRWNNYMLGCGVVFKICLFPAILYAGYNNTIASKADGYGYLCQHAYALDQFEILVKKGSLRINLRQGEISMREGLNSSNINYYDTIHLDVPQSECVWSVSSDYLFRCDAKRDISLTFNHLSPDVTKLKSGKSGETPKSIKIKPIVFITRRTTTHADGSQYHEIVLDINYYENKKIKHIRTVTQQDQCKRTDK